jgi:hypothetical protein
MDAPSERVADADEEAAAAIGGSLRETKGEGEMFEGIFEEKETSRG